ncbi:hypothetical protein H6A65_15845 [Mediterraneibacter glycyrrhizinilyticus]|uniref:plasmid mobilization protein n=1 Tax=Mediterraneibacter glycyrrhizinilyticus TaxID=342942 RepID=UPI00195F8789|nr:hypothetical protein [Mediterraneibacter glycyrrhizinilyticus]MBM6752938.1 hypothetical protein [Mediterraneibacter glycyrrhizinilyticus]
MKKERPKAKSKAISIRITEDQEKRIKQKAGQNGTTMTAYLLNRALNENGNIYDKGFFDLIIKLNHTVNYLENSFEHKQGDSRQEELLIQIEKLNQGVIDLWQYLK